MAERSFSPEEVERLIPELTRVIGEARDAYRDAAEIRERLQAEQQRITLSGGGVIDQEAWKADRARLAALTERVQQTLAAVAGMGGVTKDLGMGLVDFPHERDGRVVHLCWRLGESEIRWWHGLDEGYATRKPLGREGV
jgi:hypothetical protein